MAFVDIDAYQGNPGMSAHLLVLTSGLFHVSLVCRDTWKLPGFISSGINLEMLNQASLP